MEKVLIYENKEAIKTDVSSLEERIPSIQKITDWLLKVGICPNIIDIGVLINTLSQNSVPEKKHKEYIEDFVRNKLADKVAEPMIEGIKLSRAKFMEMIEVPDCTLLVKLFQEMVWQYDIRSIDFSLYSMLDNKVFLPDESIAGITEHHRLYATTEKQIALYNWAKETIQTMQYLSTENDIKTNLLSLFAFNENDGYSLKPNSIIGIQ